MNERIDADARLTDLESKISYQDDVIEKLNATVIAQWKQIELHTRQIAILNERLQDAERGSSRVENEPPPHY